MRSYRSSARRSVCVRALVAAGATVALTRALVACSSDADERLARSSSSAKPSSEPGGGASPVSEGSGEAPSGSPSSIPSDETAPAVRDAGAPAPPPADSGAPNVDTPAPLVECTGAPSLDRLQKWLASGEGTTVPATGSILTREGDRTLARVEFRNDEWHVVPIWIANAFDGAQVDLTKARDVRITYAATADLYVQIRPASHWSGGDKWLAKVPATGGSTSTLVLPLAPSSWTTLPELGAPSYSFAEALKDVRGLVLVGKAANTIRVYGLRIDGYTPPCL